MVQTFQAKDISLVQLSEKFGLSRSTDAQAFPEWLEELSPLSESDDKAVEEVKQEYLHLSQYDLLEPVVKLVVLSPLLKLAGFYRPPFYIDAETMVELRSQDGETLIRGQVDILVFRPDFWVTVVEAKRTQYSLEVAIPQALAYMLSSPQKVQPSYGFVTNGREFQFIKLIWDETPTYALSYTLSINRGNDLQTVVQVLRHLSEIVQT